MFIRFGAEFNGAGYLFSGWSKQEIGIVWSNEKKSVLRFPRPSIRGDWALVLTVMPFTPPCQHFQAVTISINDVVIAEQLFRGPKSTIELFLKADLLENRAECELQFEHHTALRPSEVTNSTDHRLLSIALIELQMSCLIDHDFADRTIENMLFADERIGIALHHERVDDARLVNTEIDRCFSEGGRVSHLVESYIRGLGATIHIRPRVREAIARKLGEERPELVTSNPFDGEGAIDAEVVEAVSPALSRFIFRSASFDSVHEEEILPASLNEVASTDARLPLGAGIYRPDRPAFSTLSSNVADVFVHPFQTVIYDKRNHHAWKGTNSQDLSKLVLSEPSIIVSGDIVIVSDRFSGSNLSHFLFDSITRLYHFCYFKPELVKTSKFIFGGWPSPYHRLILSIAGQQLGLNHEDIIFPRKGYNLKPSGKVVWFSDQVVFMHPAQRMHKNSMNILKGIGARIPKGDSRFQRIYISRSDAEQRRVQNEREIIEFLEGRSFDVVRLSELSPLEQIQLISNATCIVAPHGMGLTHLAFHQGRPAVVELFHPTVYSDDYALLCLTYGFRYYPIIGTETDASKNDYAVRISDIASVLGQIHPDA